MTCMEWVSVRKLASLWEFVTVRELAIARLAPLLMADPIKQVQLAYKYAVTAWLLPGLHALARRNESLGRKDVEALGLDCVLKLAAVRETYSFQVGGGGREGYDFTKALKDIFGL